jgi:maltooligosyltrehalose trehalohydrolase
MLLAPMPPLLFMGEEWDSARPFPFFCDFQGTLAEAVRAGRRKEFRHDYERHAGDIPDPLAEDTFRSAKLDWDARTTARGHSRQELVRDLLALRKAEIVPHLAGTRFGGARLEGQTLSAHWLLGNGTRLSVLANLSGHEQPCPEYGSANRSIFGGALSSSLASYAVHWLVGDA